MRKFYPVVQVVKVTYKGDMVGALGSFKLSDDPVLLYEWQRLPQEAAREKPKNTHRIIAVGDSIVFRQQWSIGDYFPKKLEDLLNSAPGNRRYEVINAGVPGYNTKQEARYLEKRLLPFSPDMVIVGYCAANDRAIKRRLIKYKDGLYSSDVAESYPYFSGRLSRWLMEKSLVYRLANAMLIRISGRLAKGRVKYFDLSFETENAVKKIKDMAQERKFSLLFVIFPGLSKGEDYECDWIIDKCRQYAIDYIDLRRVFKEAGYEKIRISGSDFHPNQLGHTLVAQELARYLNKDTLKTQ